MDMQVVPSNSSWLARKRGIGSRGKIAAPLALRDGVKISISMYKWIKSWGSLLLSLFRFWWCKIIWWCWWTAESFTPPIKRCVLFSDTNIEEHSLWLPSQAESFIGNLMIDLKPIVLFELSRCYHFNTTSISNTSSEISLLQLYTPHHVLHPSSQNDESFGADIRYVRLILCLLFFAVMSR